MVDIEGQLALPTLLCVDCLVAGVVQPAAFVWQSRAACTHHALEVELGYVSSPSAARPDTVWCVDCARASRAHRAYSVWDGTSLCIRHLAEAVHPEDDMRAHSLAHAAYLALHAGGDPDRY